MNDRYEAFCMASPVFYEALHSHRTAGEPFRVDRRPIPTGWRRQEQDDWLIFAPEGIDLPMQGWKIHVSACLENADEVLEAVWDYCVPRTIEFKFLRSMPALWLRSSKYAPRGYSGKLVTIYPPDDAACEKVLVELGEILDGQPGPYILSDLRWANGPLYVRYGGFTGRYCVAEGGQVVLAIADNTGTLVPDRREPVFTLPSWLELPAFLAPHLAARNAVTVSELPYSIDDVMHFSNGGGCYRGRNTATGDEVVLKEGRPHAGLDANGADAVARLDREYETLERLAGVPGIPAAYDRFTLGDHRFMVMEFVEGVPLHRALVRQYPMINVSATPDDFAAYTDWALRMHQQVEAALDGMHERGVVYGDLHLFNIMVRPDDTVALLDFEVASLIEENVRPGLGNQGFAAPPGTTGIAVDRYALACLRLALFLPMTQLLWLSRAKVRHLAAIIAEYFPVPPEFLARAIDVIAPPEEPVEIAWPRFAPAAEIPVPRRSNSPDPDGLDTDAWADAREQLTRAILGSATPDREDRLFPGDIEQFRIGALGLAYGAAGVLHALDVTGAGRHPELEEWLISRTRKPVHGTMIGLYDGLHGAAFALEHLGYRDEATHLLDMCLSDDWKALGSDLMGGVSGIGLNLAYFADRTGDTALRDAAIEAADLVAERLGDEDSVPETSGRSNPVAGLLFGSSGVAMLLMRAYDMTGDSGYLDRAAVALRQDLRRCIVRDSGAMEVNEGWRTMPYLAVGSVGVGTAIDEYLARRCDDDQFAQASVSIVNAAKARMYVQSGLFAGRAGILLYLAGRSPQPHADELVRAQVRGLAWHAMPWGDGLAFPGDQLLRLSMDVATGTAGVLLALGAAMHSEPVHLPLLAPQRPEIPAPTGRGLVTT
jgi:hypothetical protein